MKNKFRAFALDLFIVKLLNYIKNGILTLLHKLIQSNFYAQTLKFVSKKNICASLK